MRRLAPFIVQKRAAILWIILLATLFFSYHALKIQMYTAFSDLLPRDHPYIRVHNEFWKTFGGPMSFLSRWRPRTETFSIRRFWKVKSSRKPSSGSGRTTTNLSIARQVKDVRARQGISQPVMWPDVPRSPEAIERLRNVFTRTPPLLDSLFPRTARRLYYRLSRGATRLRGFVPTHSIKEVEDEKLGFFIDSLFSTVGFTTICAKSA
jgi:hypothetical protein